MLEILSHCVNIKAWYLSTHYKKYALISHSVSLSRLFLITQRLELVLGIHIEG